MGPYVMAADLLRATSHLRARRCEVHCGPLKAHLERARAEPGSPVVGYRPASCEPGVPGDCFG